jgi:putative ABC transport system permease protein
MYKNYAQARLPDGSMYLIRLIGLDDATLYGGPSGMIDGDKDALRQDQAVFVDGHLPEGELLMKKAKPPMQVRQIGMGDRLDINDHACRVMGRYEKTREFFWGTVVYTTFSRARAMMPQTRKNTTFILIKAAPGTDPEVLAARIHAATGLGAMTTAQMEWQTITFVLTKTGILVTFGTTAALGCVIGMLICAQLFWSFVHDNVRYFGMLKAIGATEPMMALMVAAQAGTVAFIGLGLGLGLACLMAMATAGKLAFHLGGLTVLAILAGVFFCTAVAGLVSFLRIRKIEPGIVFR